MIALAKPLPVPFLPLRLERERRGLSQCALDVRIGRKRGTVRAVETGEGLPPDRATCVAIEEALGLAPGALWHASVGPRLQRLDPDGYAWLTGLAGPSAQALRDENERLRARVVELEERIDGMRAAVRAAVEGQ